MSFTLDQTREWPDAEGDSAVDALLVDRRRIIHSTAFRRLQYKTQAFLPFEADHFRTRLTHTLEVAHIGMDLARRFEVSAEWVEAVCLAHDLGHGPFGHAGERALNDLTAGVGGFEHNDQSLRVVTHLEHPYPSFRGLNLTRAVLSALSGHSGRYDRAWTGRGDGLVSQLASWADRLAYDAGDIEDALGAELVRPDQLAGLDLWREALRQIDRRYRDRPIHAIRRGMCEAIQQVVIDDLSIVTGREGRETLSVSPTVAGWLDEWEQCLLSCVYRHPRVARTDAICEQIIGRLFETYRSDQRLLPARYGDRVGAEPIERVIADYVSGMTDRFCLKVYRQLFGEDDMLITSLASSVDATS